MLQTIFLSLMTLNLCYQDTAMVTRRVGAFAIAVQPFKPCLEWDVLGVTHHLTRQEDVFIACIIIHFLLGHTLVAELHAQLRYRNVVQDIMALLVISALDHMVMPVMDMESVLIKSEEMGPAYANQTSKEQLVSFVNKITSLDYFVIRLVLVYTGNVTVAHKAMEHVHLAPARVVSMVSTVTNEMFHASMDRSAEGATRLLLVYVKEMLTAVNAMLVMKALVYSAVKSTPVPNLTEEAVITRLSAPRLVLVPIIVHAVMVSVVMALCVFP